MPSERELSAVLSEFARTMVTDYPIQAILDHLVERIVEVLPITAAGVTLISPGLDPHYVAASDRSALCYEQLQAELGEGPCLVAYRTGDPVVVPDLREESRFPSFGPRALADGLAAVFTFPLLSAGDRLGALDLYRDTPGALDAASMEAAGTLADVAAAYLLNARARADLRDSSDRYRESSLHDALTGLPNRALLIERLGHAVLRGHRSETSAAVLFIDLDRFKQVNDSHGHGVGDELLVAVATRLSAVVRPGDTLARLHGDEFVILCEDLSDPSQVEAIARRVNAALAVPFILSSTQVEVTASVGIAYSGRGDHIPEQLLRDADTAMYQAKAQGGGRHQIVDLRDRHAGTRRSGVAADLREAVARGELRTHYQPIVTPADGTVRGLEALVRWAHPTRGLLAPAVFIPYAEQSGLITEIGRWVLAQACADRERWSSGPGAGDLGLSVNVSGHQLMAPGFGATVAAVLAAGPTRPGVLTLEMTEGVLVQDSDRALEVLHALKELGVLLAVDDFGSGYSSLIYLKRFPLDAVKIDQSLVTNLGHDPANHAIVSATIDLAHALGLTVVAKGVETAGQQKELAALGCDLCQGNWFAPPAAADGLEAGPGGGVAPGGLRLPAGVPAGVPPGRPGAGGEG